jgi:4-alpha-glucanotransferase
LIYHDWENGIPEYPETPGDAFPNNTHFGGNLYGAAEKLDYLSELGVNCIYLSPVFKAYSNHKYDIGDYLKVDENFGGDEALEVFIRKATEKGIAVILDGVFNHVGADSVYFNKYGKYPSVGAYQSKESPYSDWFTFRSTRTGTIAGGVKKPAQVRKTTDFCPLFVIQ